MGAFRSALESEGLLTDWWDNPLVFARFCEARQFDLPKALEMFRSHLAWRKTVDLDEIVVTEAGPLPRLLVDFRLPELAGMKQAAPFVHHKVSKQGFPMYYDRIGRINISAMKKVSTTQRFLRYVAWYQEVTSVVRLPAASLAAGRLVTTSVYVNDLTGFALSNFSAEMRAFLKAFVKIGADQYPQTMEQTFVINAPFVFRTVWAFINPLLDERIRRSIHILGGPTQYRPKLLEFVDEADLPAFLGGKDESVDFVHEVGPWAAQLPTL